MRTPTSVASSPRVAAPAPARAAAPAREAPRFRPYGDAARVLGTIAVVVQHVCDLVMFDGQATEGSWWLANVVDAFCRWAVPIYIMLSGALLLDPARREQPSQFYRKRLARLGIPIVFWSAFFMVFTVYYTGWRTSAEVWRDLVLGKPYMHIHFVFRLFGLYAFTPMLRVFLEHASRGMVIVTVAMLIGISSADSFMSALTGQELTVFLRFFPFLGFYLLGYLLREHRLSRRSAWACVTLLAASALILAGGTGLLVKSFGMKEFPSPGLMLYDFLSPFRVVMGVCAWLLFVHFFDDAWLNSKAGRFTSRWLAPATLGIYLVHPLFREILCLNGVEAQALPIWLGIPVVSLLVYVPSVLFTLAVMQIPYVRRIMG